MLKYRNSSPTLNSVEEVLIWKQHAHWILFFPSLAMLFTGLLCMHSIASFFFFLCSFLLFMFALFQIRSTYFILTNKSIQGSIGSLQKNPFYIPLKKIEKITIHSNFLGSYLNYGTIEVLTKTDSYIVKYLSKANYFKQELTEAFKELKKDI